MTISVVVAILTIVAGVSVSVSTVVVASVAVVTIWMGFVVASYM